MIERTLVLIKPDGVQRGIVGEIISRFEKVGLKIIGMKFVHSDEEKAKRHYTEDISERRGEHVRNVLVKFLQEAPVVALVLEGISAIKVVRKMVGATQPLEAVSGTIRGDYTHVSYQYADAKGIAVRNVIHASSDPEDAEREIFVWFNKDELYSYSLAHDPHVL